MDNSQNIQTPNSPTLTSRIAVALFKPHYSLTDLGEKRQARLIAILSLVFGAFNFIGVIAILAQRDNAVEFNNIIGFIALTAVLLIAYGISRTKYYWIANYLITLILGLTAIINFGDDVDVSRYVVAYGALGMIIAGTVLPTRQVVIYSTAIFMAVFIIPLYNPNYTRFGADSGFLLIIGALTIAFRIFRDNLEIERLEELRVTNQELRETQEKLEERVKERTEALEISNRQVQRRANQLQTVTEISRSISMVQDISKLLPSITQAISRGFGYYHVGIFLLDRRAEYAELRATNSEGGQRMLDRHHRLRVGEEGIIGYVTRFGRARIALDVGEDAVFFDNPNLPETRSEIGLPLIVAGEIIGALDVQSKEARAFSPEDISTLGALANQVSIAIQNANLFMQSQQAVEDTERAYREFIREEWVKIAPLLRQKGYSFSAAGTLPLTSATQYDKEQGVFLIPISLRGENIGELGIRTSGKDASPSPEEIAILRATADRVALALENARLFQDAQLRAWTERAISDMSSKIASSVDIDAILQSTVQELSQLVGESEVIIQISRPAAK